MANGLQRYVDEQSSFMGQFNEQDMLRAYNKGVASALRQAELRMMYSTPQPTMIGGGASAYRTGPGYVDNVDYGALATGGKVNRMKKAKKWTGFASDLVDLGLDKVGKVAAVAEGGKVNRMKKAKKWTGFASDLVDLGLDKVGKAAAVAEGGKVNRLKKAKKCTGFASDLVDLGLDKVKKIEGAGKPKKPSAWIAHVKAYAAEHQVPYKQAMMEAKTTYKK
jgi:hypothetical protein